LLFLPLMLIFGIMAKIKISSVHTLKIASPVWVDIEHVTERELTDIRSQLIRQIETSEQIADAVASAFVYAIELCPMANPSDIWQQVIYRGLLAKGFTDQQWKRISGFALERAFTTIYAPRLTPYNLRMRGLSGREAHDLFVGLDLTGQIKRDKLDRIVEVCRGDNCRLVSGLHIKASLAERIQDDVPASLALMRKGILSVMLTMDSKSFPPPHGNGINYGELGGRNWSDDKSRIKRQYVENDGQFDALISYNLRTPPSKENTPSGKKIYTISLTEEQPDVLVRMLKEKADTIS